MSWVRYIKQILYDEQLKPKARKNIISRIEKGKQVKRELLIICVKESRNLLEIVTTHELYRLEKRNKHVIIVGIVKERQKAFELIRDLINRVYTNSNRITKEAIDEELGIIWQ